MFVTSPYLFYFYATKLKMNEHVKNEMVTLKFGQQSLAGMVSLSVVQKREKGF